ncbi:hypothetical protein EJ110_NYTH40367 [Nymphaea thermarum]|nr:hypothetical protein EJ110_NYTH40367 [Nymphaea thermarum]
MKAKGLKLNAVTYSSLINCLCKHGKLSEAEIVLREMTGRGDAPNIKKKSAIWSFPGSAVDSL